MASNGIKKEGVRTITEETKNFFRLQSKIIIFILIPKIHLIEFSPETISLSMIAFSEIGNKLYDMNQSRNIANLDP